MVPFTCTMHSRGAYRVDKLDIMLKFASNTMYTSVGRNDKIKLDLMIKFSDHACQVARATTLCMSACSGTECTCYEGVIDASYM